MTNRVFLVIAAIVVFAIAAILAFFATTTLATVVGLLGVGLALYAAATLVP